MITVQLTPEQANALLFCAWHDRLGERPAQNVEPEGAPPVPAPTDADLQAAYTAVSTAVTAGA
jgi:hypothetical protein